MIQVNKYFEVILCDAVVSVITSHELFYIIRSFEHRKSHECIPIYGKVTKEDMLDYVNGVYGTEMRSKERFTGRIKESFVLDIV